jgi:hypothetical protein
MLARYHERVPGVKLPEIYKREGEFVLADNARS